MKMDKDWPDYSKDPNAEEFRKLFVGGLDVKTTEETLTEYFGGYGEIEKCTIMKDKNPPQRTKGFAFITFAKGESIDEVQKNRPHEIDAKKIETKRATPKSQHYWPTKKLYVKDFPKDLEEEDLKVELEDVFGQFGTIKDVKLIKDKDNKLKGFGFIEFEDEDPVDKCNLVRTFKIKDGQAKVAKAFPPEKNQYRPRGRGGYNPNYYDYYAYDQYYGYPPYYGGRGDYPRYPYNDFYRGGRGFNRGGGGGRPYNRF